ncbi:hypothetical protein [Microbacterium sp. C7(2022)]|uniref:hypothetical protein n=1 Tax=Microbacterium sp. C7(2022) TaxID=2992759 RepID=UPI00237B80E8|nr:hypothetical protein [Microbacterium sp. C7(2022)]MDE0546364.1 hypothetical protein [Microbacterium sp. C7(2022)]
MNLTLTVGGSDSAELVRRMLGSGIHLNEHAETLMRDIDFATADVATLRVVSRSVAELGLTAGGTLPEIFASAREQGFALCPPQIGPYLRLALTAQQGSTDANLSVGRAPDGSLTVASDPLRDDDEYPKGFYLRVVDGQSWLRGYRCDDEFVFSPGDRFVFLLL